MIKSAPHKDFSYLNARPHTRLHSRSLKPSPVIDLTLSGGTNLEFESGLPIGYTGPIIKGATILSCKTPVADLVVQEFAGDQYALRLGIGKFLKKAIAKSGIYKEGLYSYFMLKGNIRKKINPAGRVHLRQDQYAWFYTGETSCEVQFSANNEFRVLDLFYSPALLKELLPYFPELQSVIDQPDTRTHAIRTSWILQTITEITQQILNCPYDEETSRFYFDLKVRELLFQMLDNNFRRTNRTISFTTWERAKILEVKTILENYIAQKPPTIKFLSRKVAINEFKLKAGFRQFFQSGIFEWLMERKLQHAKELLQTTNKPIKEICTLVGYPRTTNFITAFRKRFGVTPGSFRRE